MADGRKVTRRLWDRWGGFGKRRPKAQGTTAAYSLYGTLSRVPEKLIKDYNRSFKLLGADCLSARSRLTPCLRHRAPRWSLRGRRR